jgi:hypothetical protein
MDGRKVLHQDFAQAVGGHGRRRTPSICTRQDKVLAGAEKQTGGRGVKVNDIIIRQSASIRLHPFTPLAGTTFSIHVVEKRVHSTMSKHSNASINCK